MDSKLLMPSAGIVVPAPMGRFLTALRELEWLHAGWRFSDPERARVVRQARAFLLSQNVPRR